MNTYAASLALLCIIVEQVNECGVSYWREGIVFFSKYNFIDIFTLNWVQNTFWIWIITPVNLIRLLHRDVGN